MKAIVCREFKNYMKNPLYWIGIVLIAISIYNSLSGYLGIHRFSTNQEVEQLKKVRSTDADIMNGYIPTTPEEQKNIGFTHIRQILIQSYDMNDQEAQRVIDDVRAQDLSIPGTVQYLKDRYDFYDGKAIFVEAKKKRAEAGELNQYINAKLAKHSYAYYFAKKYADFTGLHIAFFSAVLLAFLFLGDLKKDTYELLHTKSISANRYVWGKYFGGLIPLSLAVLMITVIFAILCQRNQLQRNMLDCFWDLFSATLLYVMPTLLICIGICILSAILFRSPLPSIPFIFVYVVYSNMGSYDAGGNYGFYGRVLGLLFRFDGGFFETKALPIFRLNQIAIVLLNLLFISLAVRRWRRRRL